MVVEVSLEQEQHAATVRRLIAKKALAFDVLKACVEIKEKGHVDLAFCLMREASQVYYLEGAFLFERAVILLNRGESAKAKVLLETCLSLDSRITSSNRSLMLIHSVAGDQSSLLSITEKAEKSMSPTDFSTFRFIYSYCSSMRYKGIDLLSFMNDRSDSEWADWERVESSIGAAIDGRCPFALVRLGDGEGSMARFDEEEEVQNFELYRLSRDRFAKRWYGLNFEECEKDLVSLWDEIRSLLPLADVVGLPSNAWIRHEMALGNIGLSCCLNARRQQDNISQTAIICRASIHFDLLQFGTIRKICEREKHIKIITCHASLKSLMQGYFPELDVDVVCIPPSWSDLGITGYSLKQPAYKIVSAIMQLVEFDNAGTVVLVAAGYVGKAIALNLKRQGHIAIDVGSIFDLLLGFASRPNFPKLNTIDWPSATTAQGFPSETGEVTGKETLPEDLEVTQS